MTNLYKDPSQIDWGNPIIIDFETFYDDAYSLSKLTMEEYIRGNRFEVIGVSLKQGKNPSKFYPKDTGLPEISSLIRRFPRSPFVGHNANFDFGILGLKYDLHPQFIADTTIMAKLSGLDRVAGGGSLAKLAAYLTSKGVMNALKGTAVHDMKGVHANEMTEQQWSAYASYCETDTDLAYDLYRYMLPSIPVQEMLMVDLTAKMYTKPGMVLDSALLKAYIEHLEESKERRLYDLSRTLGMESTDELLKHLRSSKKFSVLLTSLGVETPQKWSEKQQKMIPALSKTDQEFLDLQDSESPLVKDLVQTKLGSMSSMELTRAQTFLGISSRGDFPVPLVYAAAHTGRYGGCFKADTKVLCLTAEQCVVEKNIVDVLLSDLVWDGEEWCGHSGVEFNGYQEVITYDGLTGTKNHRVFINETTETTLFEAMQTGTPIMDCKLPPNWQGKDTSVGEP